MTFNRITYDREANTYVRTEIPFYMFRSDLMFAFENAKYGTSGPFIISKFFEDEEDEDAPVHLCVCYINIVEDDAPEQADSICKLLGIEIDEENDCAENHFSNLPLNDETAEEYDLVEPVPIAQPPRRIMRMKFTELDNRQRAAQAQKTLVSQ